MMISTKGRYALRVMIDLAEHQADGYIPLKVIAERQDISEKYLESILKALVREKILTGLRGKGGGYRLAKPPERCTVGSILRLTEGSLMVNTLIANTKGEGEKSAEDFWVKAERLLYCALVELCIRDSSFCLPLAFRFK